MRFLILLAFLIGFWLPAHAQFYGNCRPAVLPDSAEFPMAANKKVLALSDSITAVNFRYKYANGYRVMLYSGSSREQANDTKKTIYVKDKETNVYIDYQQPTFKVFAGDFVSKLEVHYYLRKVSKWFPDALIVPAKVSLR